MNPKEIDFTLSVIDNCEDEKRKSQTNVDKQPQVENEYQQFGNGSKVLV